MHLCEHVLGVNRKVGKSSHISGVITPIVSSLDQVKPPRLPQCGRDTEDRASSILTQRQKNNNNSALINTSSFLLNQGHLFEEIYNRKKIFSMEKRQLVKKPLINKSPSVLVNFYLPSVLIHSNGEKSI